jgi:hypothetical protein
MAINLFHRSSVMADVRSSFSHDAVGVRSEPVAAPVAAPVGVAQVDHPILSGKDLSNSAKHHIHACRLKTSLTHLTGTGLTLKLV